MTDGNVKINDLMFSKRTAFTRFEDWGKKKAWTPDEKKLAEGDMGHIAATAKEGRGVLKTLKIQLEGLEKRGKAAGPGWKDKAAKAVKGAEDDYAAAEKSSKALTDKEEMCEKVLAKMKK
jgi:hypothetical protein